MIGVDGNVSMSRGLGRTSVGLDPLGHISVGTSDTLGRLTSVEEFATYYDAFAGGSFDNDPSDWTLVGNRTDANATVDGQPALKVWGNVPWESVPATRTGYPLQAPGGIFFRFRLDDTNFAGRIGLHRDNYTGFMGLGFFDNKITLDYKRTSDTANTQLGIPQVANVWYRAQMTIDPDGRLTWRVWREDKPGDPNHQFSWTLDNPTDNAFFKDEQYSFFVHAGSDDGNSAVYIADYREADVHFTSYDYDLGDNLTSVTDAVGNQTTIIYNELGQKISMNDPDMGYWTYGYDSSGNLVRQTDAKDQRICFYYDAANRLQGKYHQGSGAGDCSALPTGTALATYSYYTAGIGLGQTRLQSINNPDYSESFAYDWRGRPTSHSRTIDGTGYTMTYNSYDLMDRPLQMTYPNGELVTLSYDGQFEETLQAGADLLVSNLTHNELGKLVQLDRGNGVSTQYSYFDASNAFRLQNIQHGAAGDALPDYAFAYDAIGNVLNLTESTSGDSQTQFFVYDSLNRLTSATAAVAGSIPGYSKGYTYDQIGNISSMDGQTYDYGASQPHAVKTISGGQSFGYDANGNMTVRTDATGSYTQAWDVENRLISVTQSGAGTTSFAYDVGGIRLKTSAPDGTVTHYPFPNYEVEERVEMVEADLIYVSSSTGGTLPDGVGGTFSFADEDILLYDPTNDAWSLYLDGSSIGLGATDIDAFTFLADGSILMSFDAPIFLSDIGATVDDSDIVHYKSGELGSESYFEMYLHGDTIGLTTNDEDIDALSTSPGGAVIFSTVGPFSVDGLSGQDEDLAWYDASAGKGTNWLLYLDGSSIGLTGSSEDVSAVHFEPGYLYLSTVGAFSSGTVSGTGADAFNCDGLYQGSCTAQAPLYWDGSEHDFGGEVIDGFAIGTTQVPGGTTIETRTSYGLAGQVIAQRTISSPPNAARDGLRYLHGDHLGSATAMSDASGSYVPQTLARFLPFGGYRTEPLASLTELGFTGHHENRDIGLTYMNARYYVPGIGRFVSTDSIVPELNNPQQLNRYTYVLNNAVTFNDPSGHCIFGIDTAVCVAVAFGAVLGMGVDYAIQGYSNMQDGMEFNEAFSWGNINKAELVGSGIGGAVSGGLSAYALPAVPLIFKGSTVGTIGGSFFVGASANVIGDISSRATTSIITGTPQPDMLDPMSYLNSFLYGGISGSATATINIAFDGLAQSSGAAARSQYIDEFMETAANDLWDHQMALGEALYPPPPSDISGTILWMNMEMGPTVIPSTPNNGIINAMAFSTGLIVDSNVLGATTGFPPATPTGTQGYLDSTGAGKCC